jgi:hypothetical protein
MKKNIKSYTLVKSALDHKETLSQIQMIIAALEDARLTNNNIYLTNIDFQKASAQLTM